MTTSQLWTAPDYAPFLSGSGAAKLVDSGVAPLVAAARGMRTVTPGEVKTFLSYLGIMGNTTQGKQIKSAVGSTDALYMPWYRAVQVIAMQRDGEHRPSIQPQFRPDPTNLVYDEKGKAPKYVNLSGAHLVIGPHPAFPAAWMQTTGVRHMFTEGMIKADSALTSMLLDAGITAAQLSIMAADIASTEEMTNVVTCRNRLQALLELVPADKRILIYGFVSVTTWKNNPEWNSVDLRDVDCYVAYDGDTATNPKVWKQAHDLFDFLNYKKAHPKLVDMKSETMPNGDKCGMDDYLAHVGDWVGLLKLATDKLPERPEGDEAKPGDWRMNDKTRLCEEFVAGREEDTAGTWRPKHNFTTRVSVVEDRRAVSDEEMRTGQYSARTDSRDMDSRVELEVEWFDDGKDPQTGTICGPHDLLMCPPTEWRRIQGADIPSSVAFLESWPPREPEFLKAMKAARRNDVAIRPLWTHMGWVPTKDAAPVFLVGNQVIGSGGEMPTSAATSVTGKDVQSALKFGVQVPDEDTGDEDVRSALRRVLAAYRPTGADINNGPFQNRKHASIVLAAGLRPCAPIKCQAPIILTGSTSAGKSWASAAIMMFWQQLPGTWTNKQLPGSANDTFASSEVALSKTPIWVLDDLAPSEDDPTGTGRKAEAVWTLVRNVFQGASRARRTSDMKAQELHTPRAQLIVSAEKTPETNQSIMNRVIHIKVRTGEFLNPSHTPTKLIEEMGRTDCPQSLITGYVLQMLARRASRTSWKKLRDDLNEEKMVHTVEARQVVTQKVMAGADPSRQSETAADLALGITMLSWALDELGMLEEYSDDLVEMRSDLYDVARDGYDSAQEIVLGKQFVTDLQSLLHSHTVHIASCGASGVPMTAGDDLWHKEAEWINDALGWSRGDDKMPDRPNGDRIGDLVYDTNKVPCIVFNTKAAFAAVQRSRGGWKTHSSTEVWDSVVTQGYRHEKAEGGWAVKASGGHAGLHQRITKEGRTFDGVAIPLAKILGVTAAHVADSQEPGYDERTAAADEAA